MKSSKQRVNLISFAVMAALSQSMAVNAYAHGGEDHTTVISSEAPKAPACQLLMADRVFDGEQLLTGAAVLIKKEKVAKVGSRHDLRKSCPNKIDLGDATILPGFIESHAHMIYQSVNQDVVLKHGITTVRDVGGPLLPPTGGQGTVRLLSAGPIIQAPDGYPLNIFGGGSGYDKIGINVSTPKEAQKIVRNLADGGAAVIKVGLETGGEAGAPWMMDHGQGIPAAPWPLMSLDTLTAIVTEAHALNKKVTAHIGENEGAKLALAAGVDEWAHVPCAAIDDDLLQQAVDQGVKVVSTIDTLASCSGIYANTMSLAAKMRESKSGSEFIYGSEIAHDNVPWGINGEELHLMLHLTSGGTIDFPKVVEVIKSATSTAGKNLGLEPLGTLTADAPADVIAVRGNAFERFKILEYPDLVISGGRTIVNNFAK
ncbi:MAG: amidohydrolase [Methylococcaceae bacterium]|nr:MAG: amidohydrolase [Methylococcaceae bacterium]